MKKTKIDRLGRIVIPKDYRRALSIAAEAELSLELVDDSVVVRLSCTLCRLCGKRIDEQENIPLCEECINKIRQG